VTAAASPNRSAARVRATVPNRRSSTPRLTTDAALNDDGAHHNNNNNDDDDDDNDGIVPVAAVVDVDDVADLAARRSPPAPVLHSFLWFDACLNNIVQQHPTPTGSCTPPQVGVDESATFYCEKCRVTLRLQVYTHAMYILSLLFNTHNDTNNSDWQRTPTGILKQKHI
jgi:hypothetical protein